MSEKVKAVIGSKEKANFIKEWFIKQGAKNIDDFSFEFENHIYFMDKFNNVHHLDIACEYLFNIVNIDIRVIAIQGDKHNGINVINYLKDHEGKNDHKYAGDDNEMYYYVDPITKVIESASLANIYLAGYIPDIHEADTCTLKPFDKVLVKDGDEDPWICDIFSHYDPNAHQKYCCVGGACWYMAISYEGNEDKVGKIVD